MALGHDLFALFVVWWCQDECAVSFANLAVEWLAAVSRVANSDSGVLVHEHWYGPWVMDIGARECKRTEPALVVDAGVQLEAVMLTLPVVASVCDTSSHSVEATTHQFADREHGSIHEAKLRFAL